MEDGEAVVPVWQDKHTCVRARNGDNLMCPFQCDMCHSRNIKKRDPSRDDLLDKNLLRGIRRASLDAFFARRPGTVSKNVSTMLRNVKVHTDIHGI
jgi:pyruvate-formate lyase-activating enzyme